MSDDRVFRCNPDESAGLDRSDEELETTDEQEAAFRESFGYALNDPKHPTYFDRFADIWDMREGK